MFKPRRPEFLALIVAIYVALVLNQPFWRKFAGVVAPSDLDDWLFAAAVVTSSVLVAYLVLLALSAKPLLRILLLILLPAMAAAAYFMGEYGIVIDVHMVRNVFETDTREANDLITLKLVAYVVLLGLAPAVLFWLVPWTKQSYREETAGKLKAAAASLLLLVAVMLPVWGNFISLGRDHRELKMTLTPINFFSALTSYWRQEKRKRAKTIASYGEDAHQSVSGGSRKSLFVLVVGETARADHFSINGYPKPTNPGLSKIGDLINYSQAYSCGTDTAQSVPCIFSGLGRDGFTNAKADARENLLDIFKRAGLDVVWRENQSGCKGVCARIPTETLTGHKVPTFYASTQNFDDILVDGLDARIAKLDRDTVIVLHMMGSHGPAYWKRYPEKFETFKPACKDSQFSRCELQDIVNAYDNSILYTDHVLARLIETLKGAASRGVDAGMIYVSDHGESLGENGMYLHGMPYVIAPEAQIHVPMFVWLSPEMKEARGLDQGCMVSRSGSRVGHDNIFHSSLGIMGVATRVYDPSLDLFAPCRKPAS
ncbi:phosphoethanolamine transferase [Hyphomicrobium facile]|uniref:Lipid A ethanolaminephosphotransferase n=1 Tax=Hyphomicrobium facile TaxID=51670 RepID=A0A1I7MTZ8_9HYPH|nr:phosphoethanolamine--lipid A transferase [Hyphomicrobium facile]SFV25870.1 lipid A ethanolaminephosphotransferase [Hyphomicrobium facile]